MEDFLEDEVNPVDLTNLGIQQRKLLGMMEVLPEDQQQVLKYKFFEDLTNEEIAYVMGKTEGAIRVIQHRAIMRLKELLNQKE